MKGYEVYAPTQQDAVRLDKVDRLVFIKQGVAWLAILSPLLWSLYHRLWSISLVVFCLTVVMIGLLKLLGLSPLQNFILMLIVNAIFAIESSTLRQWQAKQDGLKFEGFVSGYNKEDCQRRFLEGWLSKV